MAPRFAFSQCRGMLRVLLLGASVSVTAPVVAETVEVAPSEVVTLFLEKVKTAPSEANAMLTDDAQMAVGHVGGEMDDVSILTMMFDEIGEDCHFTDIKIAENQMDEFPDITTVTSKYQCANPSPDVAVRQLDVSFFVREAKIAGFILHADGPPLNEYDAPAEVEE